jgi:hypothetical protein
MGRRRKKKHFRKYKSVQQTIQPVAAPQNQVPAISLQNDADIQKPTSPVISEVKKISIIMTLLIFVVAAVAIVSIQTDWINSAGQRLMNLLHIYGA